MQTAIVYIAPAPYAFVLKDIEGLKEKGLCVHTNYFGSDAWRLPLAFITQLLRLILLRVSGVKVALVHFAGYHAVLPVLLGFRTYIIIAGADACSFPAIDYGSFRKLMLSAAMRFVMRKARALLPVHASLERFENRFSDFGPVEQGYSRFVPGLRTPNIPIPYGFDATTWTEEGVSKSRSGAICVAMGAANGNAVHFRKGIDMIIEAARALPDMSFTVVGVSTTASYTSLPSNLHVLSSVGQDNLRRLFRSSSYYLQPSVMEGFPNALCEAMLCGCLPVVSSITSMPEIIDGCGIVLIERRSEALSEAIRRLIAIGPEQAAGMRLSARERILKYSITRRIDALTVALSMGKQTSASE